MLLVRVIVLIPAGTWGHMPSRGLLSARRWHTSVRLGIILIVRAVGRGHLSRSGGLLGCSLRRTTLEGIVTIYRGLAWLRGRHLSGVDSAKARNVIILLQFSADLEVINTKELF
jgi:hypothetical protein